MTKALIGYTGLVGSNLNNQIEFDYKYNSSNISEIQGKHFDLVICAGIRAEKWIANKFPQKDYESISSLIENLKKIHTKLFVHISTIEVYPVPIDVDENTEIDHTNLAPYGKNRLFMEEFITSQFKESLILRFPILFGKGFKKNFLFDLLNRVPKTIQYKKYYELIKTLENQDRNFLEDNYLLDDNKNYKLKENLDKIELKKLEKILASLNFSSLTFTHKDSVFQFYYLDNLWKDIQIALQNSLSLINISTEPISAKDLAKRIFNIEFENITENKPIIYDMKTIYYKQYEGNKGYIYSNEEVYKQIVEFIRNN